MATYLGFAKVYSGKNGKCMCGCAGNYSSNERSVKVIVNKILRSGKMVEEEGLMFAVIGNRILAAYKMEPANEIA